jgi:hypothetical protein
LLHFCDDALATSIRMENAVITQTISVEPPLSLVSFKLNPCFWKWQDSLDRFLLLTTTFEDQVNQISTVYREIHAVVAERDVLPLSHTGMQNRLETLRVSPAANINTTVLERCWYTLIQNNLYKRLLFK